MKKLMLIALVTGFSSQVLADMKIDVNKKIFYSTQTKGIDQAKYNRLMMDFLRLQQNYLNNLDSSPTSRQLIKDLAKLNNSMLPTVFKQTLTKKGIQQAERKLSQRQNRINKLKKMLNNLKRSRNG